MPRRLLRLSPWVVAALGAAVYLLLAPPSADLAAQEYRAGLGLTLCDNGWFAGHHTPGYSVLFPPLGGALGVRVIGGAGGGRRGGARASATLSDTAVTVRADRAGPVRVHFTRWWRVTGGRGCVSEAPGAMTRVTLPAAGTIRLQARLPGASCRR